MSDHNGNFDFKKVIEQGTQRTTIKDLAERGVDNVKVLDEDAVHSMIQQAVDRVVNLHTAGERDRILGDSRKELDRLLREHSAMKSRAQLLETDKNGLVQQVEALQRQLQLKDELEEETLHRKLQEGLSSLNGQVEELRRKAQSGVQEVQDARAECARLQDDKARMMRETEEARSKLDESRRERDGAAEEARRQREESGRAAFDRDRQKAEAQAARERHSALEKQLAEEQSKSRGAEKARTDLVQQVLTLQSRSDGQEQELRSLRPEIVRQRSELARTAQELDRARAQDEAQRGTLAKEREAVQELEETLQRLRDERSKLADETASRSTELARARAELLEAQEAGRRAGRQASDSGERAGELEGTLQRLREEHAKLSDEAGARKAQLERLEEALEKERQAVLQAGRQSTESGRHAQELEEALQELQEKHEALSAQAEAGRDARAKVEQAHAAAVDESGTRAAALAQREREVARLAQELERERESTRMAEQGRFESGRKAQELEDEIQRLGAQAERLRGDLADLGSTRSELEELRPRLEQAERGWREAQAEAERLHVERAALAHDTGSQKADLERHESRIAELTAALEPLQDSETSLRRRVGELEGREEELAQAAQERDQVREELEGVRQETAFLKGQLAAREKEHDSARDKTVIVTAELQEIEHQQKEERQNADRLRQERERLGLELEAARTEVRAVEELMAREQETTRVAQNESASLLERISEAQGRSEAVERELETLKVENARLQERLASAKLQERLASLETLLEQARRSSQSAKASADRSREVTAELERTLQVQRKPATARKPGSGSIRGGAAFDGMAVLEGFLRKIRLREHVQKYVPVTEEPGRPHSSEMMVEVLKSIITGQGKEPSGRQIVPLEIVGPSGAPDPEALRRFLGGLSSQAVRALANVHHALRLHLTPLPKRPHSLAVDLVSLELGQGRRLFRPLVSFDPVTREFLGGQLRPNRALPPEAIHDALKSAIGRVPAPFARQRIRLRMDEGFFNEGVVRLLESKGVSYVIAAPDSPGLRKEARKRAFHKLTNGWEVSEFSQRLHPIRRTQARFVVLRRRMSKVALEAGRGTFRDERHVYHVFATDRRATPWRSFEFYQGRPQAVADATSKLAAFTRSPLLGRSRRSMAALFQAHLLASDLVQWFRRSCLPEEERSRELPELRTEFLWVPPKPGVRSLLVLPRRDRRRRLFTRVARLTRRVRPARPFRFRA